MRVTIQGDPNRVWHRSMMEDVALRQVVDWFRSQPDLVHRLGSVIRRSLDEVFDGQRTGRYRMDQLSKVEKSYIGTKIEIILQDEFGLSRGRRMDYSVDGVDVDAKWSMRFGGWMIPTEAVGELCICLTGDDETGTFSVGVVRAAVERLTGKFNKDGKGRLSQDGLNAAVWLVDNEKLPENLLLHLSDETREAVLDPGLSRQQRVVELFHRVQERIISREVVLTVAQQLDGPKRVRDARRLLAPLDIEILGHQDGDPEAAAAFGLPVPRKGEWVSVSVEPAEREGAGAALVRGRWVRPVFPRTSAG